MAYTHWQKDQTLLTTAGVYAFSADVVSYSTVRHAAGYQPFIVRALWVQNLTTIVSTSTMAVEFYKNTAANLTTATGNHTAIDIVNLSTVALAGTGEVYFIECTPTKIGPGQEIVASVITAATEALIVKAGFYAEATTDEPAGNSLMTESS